MGTSITQTTGTDDGGGRLGERMRGDWVPPVVTIPADGVCPVCGFGRADHRRRADVVPGRDVWQCRQWADE